MYGSTSMKAQRLRYICALIKNGLHWLQLCFGAGPQLNILGSLVKSQLRIFHYTVCSLCFYRGLQRLLYLHLSIYPLSIQCFQF